MEDLERMFKNDQYARHSGIELVAVSPGRATARMTVGPHHLNGLQTVQGGAIFTLADHAFAAAANSSGFVAVAVNVSITFLKAATEGTLWAEAREVAGSGRLASCAVEVKDDRGELVALFQGLAYRKREKTPEAG